MAKTIDDYKKDYDAARQRGDAAGMQAANDGANAIRRQQGVAEQEATADIAGVASRSASATGVGVWDGDQSAIRDQMNQNSEAWHTASPGERKRLEQENQNLAAQLSGSVSFNPGTGTWGGTAAVPDFTYENAADYVSGWDSVIKDLAGQILNRPAFSYDYTQDPLYQQYKESYTREGQRAMQDTLGQVSARTGGLASSYATTAAQQANSYYMQQLNDKIPELQQLAYDMWLNEGDMDRANLEMLLGLENRDYSRWRDQVGDSRYENEWNYGIYRDTVSDKRYEEEQARLEEQKQYERQLAAAGAMAETGDFSGYAQLWNLTPEQTQRLVDNYARQKQLTEQEAARDLAGWYAQYGDFSKLKEMGVNTAYLEQERYSGLYGGSGGGGGEQNEGYKPLLSYDDVMEYIEKHPGERLPRNIAAAYEYYMGEVYGNTGADDTTYRGIRQTIYTNLNQGKLGSAQALFNQYATRLTDEQLDDLLALFSEKGYDFEYSE